MSESSAASAHTHGSVFTVSGTNSDDAQSRIVSLMESGVMTAEEALRIMLEQQVNMPPSRPPGSDPALTQPTAISSGSLLGAGLHPPGLPPSPVQDEDMKSCGSQPGPHQGASAVNIPLTAKRLSSSVPRGRGSMSPRPKAGSRNSSKPPCSPAGDGQLRASEKAREKLEKENQLLEQRLNEALVEAKQNELAWEFSQTQKTHEVGRLQDMVKHASNQNQQLRWNEETQAQETMRWAEQAMSFKTEAERLTEVQTQSKSQR